MEDWSTIPILDYQPGGGVPVGPVSNPPVYSQHGTTQLVAGQSYVDVVFGSIQTTDEWVLVECIVVNELDVDPLNIWPGIITDKTAAGFRLQLNGMPDSGNYYLHWAVSGINITPSPASTYQFSGPASGRVDEPSTFTVRLSPSTTVPGSLTIMPDDGGAGGAFSPSSVTLNTTSASATFTYTPTTYGVITLGVTNSGTLIDPTNLSFTSLASTYQLSGPSTGSTGAASTNFSVALPVGGIVTGTVTVTMSDAGDGGTFTPTTVALTTASPSHTFTYTPASIGDKTISVTNNGGLINPGNLTYTATPHVISDGDPISTWPDSSVNVNHATRTGSSRPIYKTNIINGKPVARFTSAGLSGLNLTTPISPSYIYTVFAVMKGAAAGSELKGLQGASKLRSPWLYTNDTINSKTVDDAFTVANPATGAFHVITCIHLGAATTNIYLEGTITGAAFWFADAGADSFAYIGWDGASEYSNGDIAELIYYSTGVVGNRANIEKYLGDKYGITVAGGAAVQPDTVTGLVGWWKADAIV